MKRGLFKIFHNVKLCPKICSIKYPWGWRSNDEILKLIKEQDSKHKNLINTAISRMDGYM